MRSLAVYSLLLIVACPESLVAQQKPVYPAPSSSIERLLDETSDVRAMTEAEVVAMVPVQSGLHYVGCPNCQSGRQENQLTWSVKQPDRVSCQYCQHQYPSAQYPMNQSVKVGTPNHGKAEYPYWADATGYRFFFAAKRDDLCKCYMAEQAYKLAWLYQRTGDEAHARRALLILSRMADVFPSWCFHYDYPFRQKEIFDGPVSPSQFRPGYRTARWTWWAYSDIPVELIQAYDWLSGSLSLADLSRQKQFDVARHIENDLFLPTCQQVLDNQETYSNMSPRAWLSLTTAGRVLRKPEYIHHVMRCMEQLVVKNFFYDGTWCEGSPDYEHQTVTGLKNIIDAMGDYRDPPNYRDPVDGKHFEGLSSDDSADHPNEMKRTLATLDLVMNSQRMLLPDGRSVPVHDTWPTSKRRSSAPNQSQLWPALGHACLATTHFDKGNAKQLATQLHMTWSGGYGHSHGDNLSILLFARDRETLSDLGYTHTAYRGWTLATAAHNTVVIDERNQAMGSRNQPSDGSLYYSQLNDDRFNIVVADGSRAYPGLAQQYNRAVMMITASTHPPYMLDIFDVEGGRTHDYFLHGWADGPSHVTASIDTQPRASLISRPDQWIAPKNEGQSGLVAQPHYAYGFLSNLKTAEVKAAQPITVDFTCAAQGSLSQSIVRIRLLPELNSELILGENPSIRKAEEDDARLKQFKRPFMLLRHNSEGSSRFISLIEEFSTEPCIKSIENLSTETGVVIKIQLEASAEQPDRPTYQWILMNVTKPIEVPCPNGPLKFEGRLGFLSHNQSKIDRIQCSGNASWSREFKTVVASHEEQDEVTSIDDQQITLRGASSNLPRGTALLQTEDGWTYPLTVLSTLQRDGQTQLTTREAGAFQWNKTNQELTGKMFPQRQHKGKLTLRWFTQESLNDYAGAK